MSTPRILAAALAVAALSTSTAVAATPWSAPVTVPGALDFGTGVIFTPAGHGVMISATAGSGESNTQVNAVGADGTPGVAQHVALFSARLAAYGSDHFILAGTHPATTGAQAQVAPVELAIGTPATGTATPHAVPDTAGQSVQALAGNATATVALVTAKQSGHRERTVWVRVNGTVKRVLTISVSGEARGSAVSVGAKGDILVAWEDHHTIYSRHIGPTGRAASTHKLGAGVQSGIQVRYDESGRQEVAWITQRVSEGYAATPATISYTSAAAGHNFTTAKVVGRANITGTGRYVSGPGVRLVGSGTDSSVLAMTVYDGAHFRVQAADVAAGIVQTPQNVSPAGEDDVLGDLAYARAGGTVVLWNSNTRGADPVGGQSVIAATRAAGQPTFAAPQQVSGPEIPFAPSAAVNPVTGGALAVVGSLAGTGAVSTLDSLR